MRISVFIVFVFLLCCCNGNSGHEKPAEYLRIQGETMGTYYRVTYADAEGRDLQPGIEKLLQEINGELSTYIDTSLISRFNRAAKSLEVGSQRHILINLKAAKEVFEKSSGAFDPTVMPLVNYWGFGYTEKKPVTRIDSAVVDSLRALVGFDKVSWRPEGEGLLLEKAIPGIQLDLSASAKGYAVDAVGSLLETRGVVHYLVDIGGEIKVRGKNPRGGDWNIGINTPVDTAELTDVQEILPLTDRAVATSGPYRNYYEIDGVKYSHTINPVTGFPQRNTLLSVSVFTDQCMIADAYATAFLVLGKDKALDLAASLPDLDAYLIYGRADGTMGVKYTKGLSAYFDKTAPK